MSTTQHYTFGDNDRASARLHLLAAAYAPSTTAFLRSLAREPASQIVDLGCGPGLTTALLGDAFAAATVVGLDSSPRFVAEARRERAAGLAFTVHDISVVPFPAPPADLIYGRFILTHLARPEALIQAWASAAAPGGRLALEELIAMESPDPLFAGYYSVVEAMQRALGQTMYIGAELESLCAGSPWIVEQSQTITLLLPGPTAARLHALNIQTWKAQPFIQSTYPADEIEAMAAGLTAVADGTRAAPPVTCRMRQMVARIGGSATTGPSQK